jgi:hypothetical protein
VGNRLSRGKLLLHCDMKDAAMQHVGNSGGEYGFYEILQKAG